MAGEEDKADGTIFLLLLTLLSQRQFPQYKERILELCKKSKSIFNKNNSSVFIPHPDSNPAERSMYRVRVMKEKNLCFLFERFLLKGRRR